MNKVPIYRLDRWLSNQTSYSRKEVKFLVKKKRLTVNGETVKASDLKVKETDQVMLDGVEIILAEHAYYMQNKPSGVVSATQDALDPTVLDILPEGFWRPGLFPAGRLDKDTEGFVLLTDDGKFGHQVTAPKKRIPKIYFVELEEPLDMELVKKAFNQPITLGEGEVTTPALIGGVNTEGTQFHLTIYEGLYHQVKRMIHSVGGEVAYLKRIQIGGLPLDPKLELGDVRRLTQEERDLIQGVEKAPC